MKFRYVVLAAIGVISGSLVAINFRLAQTTPTNSTPTNTAAAATTYTPRKLIELGWVPIPGSKNVHRLRVWEKSTEFSVVVVTPEDLTLDELSGIYSEEQMGWTKVTLCKPVVNPDTGFKTTECDSHRLTLEELDLLELARTIHLKDPTKK